MFSACRVLLKYDFEPYTKRDIYHVILVYVINFYGKKGFVKFKSGCFLYHHIN